MAIIYLQIASGDFLAIYTVEVNTENTYVKPKSVFTGNADTFSYVTVAYNEDTSMCQEFDSADADVDVRREFRFRCLRFDNYVVTQKGDQETRFISQDPSRYFWWFICLDGSARSFASCDEGFFDLNIPDNRETEELDLAGLPWDKIAEDLEDFTGLQFDDVRDDVKYAWLGEECDLHGGR